jgi:nucleotidyltransferase substrate binding protein (TIGR01987 family)
MKIDRLRNEIDIFRQASARFNEALEQEKNSFIRDSAIKRFEFTFELFWKSLKLYAEYEGRSANSPRSAFREAFLLEIISESPVWFQMLEDRNNTAHAYKEKIAEEIYSRLGEYSSLMSITINKIDDMIN